MTETEDNELILRFAAEMIHQDRWCSMKRAKAIVSAGLARLAFIPTRAHRRERIGLILEDAIAKTRPRKTRS
jgi:hypothetical protein